MKNIKNGRQVFLIALFLVVSLTAWIVYFVNLSKIQQINFIKSEIVQDAKNNFDYIVSIRQWNINNDGVYLKKDGKLLHINHSWMTRQISQLNKNHDRTTYKITSLKPLNPLNKPTSWEENALKFFDKHKDVKFYYNENQLLKNKDFSLIGSLTIEQACLKCHGVQGYKIGDIKGGIRISMPVNNFIVLADNITTKHNLLMALIVLISFSLLYVIYRLNTQIFNQQDKLEELNTQLEIRVDERTKELHELNESLEVRVEEAIEQNKIQEEMMIMQSRHAAMGEMISMIAHQWRQPITTISMAANNIKMDVAMDMIENDTMDTIADEILEQTDYLSNTIDDFRDFFKPNKEKQSFLPQDVIEESMKIMKKSLTNNDIEIVENFQKTSTIESYSRELLQVIINLVKNAKEALVENRKDGKKITINLYEEDNSIVIEVIDNGGGIPNDIIDFIFDPYFSTKNEKNGTGLGLYMSETIISKHFYGSLTAQNVEDGAMFRIVIPT